MSISAYNLYKIGDIFHNSNGDDYIILNLNAERDKALLAKKLDAKEAKIANSPALFIGAKGLRIKDWCHGHYFMSDFQEAVKWFMTDDKIEPIKEKGPTVEDILKLYQEEDHAEYAFSNYSNYIRFKSIAEIPDYLKHAELKYFSAFGTYNGIDDMEFPHASLSFVLTDDVVILTVV